MSLDEWAQRWCVPPAAIVELCASVTYRPEPDEAVEVIKSEARVQSEVRLEAAAEDVYLFRNNVGAGKIETPSGHKFMRWGLGNESEQINSVLKSADLIGLRKRLIVARDVGTYIGQFISREIKPSKWKFSGTIREHAQVRWATLINAQGGDAQIVTGAGSLKT